MVFGGKPQYDTPAYPVQVATTTASSRGDSTEFSMSVSRPNATVAQRSTAHEEPLKVLATTSRMELSNAAKRAHAYLLANTEGKGIISSENVRLYPHPMSYNRPKFEFNFDRPEPCVIIPRDFFPEVGTDTSIRMCAIRHAESQDERHVEDMFCLIKELRCEIREVIKMKMRWHFTTHIKLAKIPYNNRCAQTKEEVFKAWVTCNPDRFLIQQFHTLLYQSFSSQVYDSFVYDIYLDFGLWLDKGADGALLTNKNAGDHKARTCSIRRMVVMMCRDYVRGRFCRKSLIPHGIILTISRDENRSSLGRRKRKKANSEFEFKRFVKGWRSPKHLLYCKENNFTIPSIPELEDGIEVEDALQPILFESTTPANTTANIRAKITCSINSGNDKCSTGLPEICEGNENIGIESTRAPANTIANNGGTDSTLTCSTNSRYDSSALIAGCVEDNECTRTGESNGLHKRQKVTHAVAQLPPMDIHTFSPLSLTDAQPQRAMQRPQFCSIDDSDDDLSLNSLASAQMNGGRSACKKPAVATKMHADCRNGRAKDLRINGGCSASNKPVATTMYAHGRNDSSKDVHESAKDVRIKELEALFLASQQESVKQKEKLAEMQRNQNSMMEDISRQRETSAKEDAKVTAHCVKEVAKKKKKDDVAKRAQNLAPGKPKGKKKPILQQTNCVVGEKSKTKQGELQRPVVGDKLPITDDTPDSEHPAITAILGVRYKKQCKQWQCHYVIASKSGKYVDISGWEGIETLYDDLTHDKDAEESGNENLLVTFMRDNWKKGWLPAAKIVAQLCGVGVSELFPMSQDKATSRPQRKKASDDENVLLPDHCSLCNHDVFDDGSYKAVEAKYYFSEDRKYSGGRCYVCKTPYKTDKNNNDRVIPLPTTVKPAYVCKGMDKDKCDCGVIVCCSCYMNKQEKQTGRRSRRS